VVAGVSRAAIFGPLCLPCPFDIQSIGHVQQIVSDFTPDEIYYLAAHHHAAEAISHNDYDLVQRSFAVNTFGLHNFLDVALSAAPRCKIFYASSSHVFGEPVTEIQTEETPFNPICAYGISKAAGVQLCRYYRRRHGAFVSVGILYNHESPKRAPHFVFRKVVKAAVDISLHHADKLTVGSLDSRVDWGYAPDYVDAMWRILQLNDPHDFVVASGELHSVRELVEIAFGAVGLDWQAYVEVDPAIARKRRSGVLRGDSSKLRRYTGWSAKKSFREMIEETVRIEIDHEH
jgi:GDPmannose 4,6-dehydratase